MSTAPRITPETARDRDPEISLEQKGEGAANPGLERQPSDLHRLYHSQRIIIDVEGRGFNTTEFQPDKVIFTCLQEDGTAVSILELENPGRDELSVLVERISQVIQRGGGMTTAARLLSEAEAAAREGKYEGWVSYPTRHSPRIPLRVLKDELHGFDITMPMYDIDRLIECRKQFALFSRESLDKISMKVVGDKILVFLDINNMNVANKFGYHEAVDSYLKDLRVNAEATLGLNHRFELVRLGDGDEFALVIQNKGEKTVAALNAFRDAMEESKERCLAGGNCTAREPAEDFAALRSQARATFDEYLDFVQEGKVEYTIEGYHAWLCAALGEKTSPLDVGSLTLLAAEKRLAEAEKEIESRLLAISFGVVPFGRAPAPNDVMRQLGLASKIMKKGQDGIPSDLSPEALPQLTDNIRLRADEERILDLVRALELRVAEHQAALFGILRIQLNPLFENSMTEMHRLTVDLQRAACEDLSVSDGALSMGSVYDRPFRYLADVHVPTEFWATKLDIARLGPINNQLGYERANRYLRDVCKEIRETFPEAVIVKAGGAFYILTSELPSAELRTHLEHRTTRVMVEAADDEKTRTESLIKSALDQRLGEQGIAISPEQPLGTTKVYLPYSFVAEPEAWMGKTILENEQNARF